MSTTRLPRSLVPHFAALLIALYRLFPVPPLRLIYVLPLSPPASLSSTRYRAIRPRRTQQIFSKT